MLQATGNSSATILQEIASIVYDFAFAANATFGTRTQSILPDIANSSLHSPLLNDAKMVVESMLQSSSDVRLLLKLLISLEEFVRDLETRVNRNRSNARGPNDHFLRLSLPDPWYDGCFPPSDSMSCKSREYYDWSASKTSWRGIQQGSRPTEGLVFFHRGKSTIGSKATSIVRDLLAQTAPRSAFPSLLNSARNFQSAVDDAISPRVAVAP